MTREEYFRMLDRSEEQYRRGEYRTFAAVEEQDEYIRALCPPV